MSVLTYDVVAPREAEEVLNYTIDGGESLLLYGVDDFSEILSWINLADLSLEFIPSCRDSLHTCLDWYRHEQGTSRGGLSILRDARSKIYNPLYFGLYEPSTEYQMLVERVCGGRAASGSLVPSEPSPKSFL